MAPVNYQTSILFTPGRAPGPILAVVLHEYNSGLEMLDGEMDRCPRPRPTGPRGCHNSFHYGIGGNGFHQYIADANTAWGFGALPPTCPVPPCPVDTCAACLGLLPADYNGDELGNPATPPAFVAGADGTANNQVIHVAIAIGNYNLLCCENFLQNRVAYNNLVASLYYIFDTTGLTVDAFTTLLVHCGELECLDLQQLADDIEAYVPPLPILPCDCITGTDPGDGLTMAIVGGIVESDIVLDPAPGNTLSLSPAGLLGTAGAPALDVATPAPGSTINVNTSSDNRFLVTTVAPGDNINLALPLDGPVEIWIKNIGVEDLTITPLGGATIDGVAVITLAGTIPAGYPFGNNGGEAVQLLWSGSNWFVL